MLPTILFFSVDVPLRASRVRGSALPQEYMLSRFVNTLLIKDKSWTDNTPACEWKFVECDTDKHVTSLKWQSNMFQDSLADSLTIKGELQWVYTPHTLLFFRAYMQALFGSLHLSLLPPRLITFDIALNRCSGHLDLTHLPCSLVTLDLNFNKFEGEIDLSCLPASLKTLNLCSNELYGNVDLTKISKDIESIKLAKNYFFIPETIPEKVFFGIQKNKQ